jgi:hypothetical protein
MEKVRSIDPNLDNHPAFKWCASKGKDWYLPAFNELRVARQNGGISWYRHNYDDLYWTSESSMFYASIFTEKMFYDMMMYSARKNSKLKTKAVIRF